MLIDELLDDGYDYILTARLQSDPIERRFSQYRQMSGGRFLVSLREVLNTERILTCRSLIKENINFWEEDLKSENQDSEMFNQIDEALEDRMDEIIESVLDDESSEVATTISGYIAKKLLKRSKCELCISKITVSNNDLNNDHYLKILSRGGLFVPPKELADFVCSCFAILDFVESEILAINQSATKLAMYVLKLYAPSCEFCCEFHKEWGTTFAAKIVINVFFNNKQKHSKDLIRKDAVTDFKTRQRNK